MAVVWGVTGLFYVNNVLVAGQTNLTLTREKDTMETTNKDVAENKSYLAGWRGWTFDVEGFADLADSGYTAVEAMWSSAGGSGSIVSCKAVFPSGAVYTGNCILTSLSNGLPHDGVVSFSMSFQGTGALTKS